MRISDWSSDVCSSDLTGDVGHMDDDGFLFIGDRLKDMIISGGENIFSAEVENALGSHPAILDCAVIGVPDPRWGERVHAIVRLREGMVADADRSEEPTSDLQSLMRISYAVFCLKQKTTNTHA